MEKLLKILRDVRPDIDFESEKALIEDGLLESFDVVSIVTEIEETFEVEISMSEIQPEDFNSLESIWDLIQRKK